MNNEDAIILTSVFHFSLASCLGIVLRLVVSQLSARMSVVDGRLDGLYWRIRLTNTVDSVEGLYKQCYGICNNHGFKHNYRSNMRLIISMRCV